MASSHSNTDVFVDLPLAEFRGCRFPITERSCRHAHEVAKTVIQYFGKQLAEIVNGDNLVFEYTIPFRQGVSISPYLGVLFHSTLSVFWDHYINTDPGTLIDPIRGEFQVLPGSWEEITDVKRRDGIDVRIMFIEAPNLAELEGAPIGTLPGAQSDALALDGEVAKMPWTQEPSPEPATDPLSAIAGILTQVGNAPGKVAARMYDCSARCQKIEDALTRLEDPKTSAAPVKASRDLRLKSTRLAEHALSAKPIRNAVTSTVQTVSALAAEHGMAVADFLELNSALARSPIVASGSVVYYR